MPPYGIMSNYAGNLESTTPNSNAEPYPTKSNAVVV
jgi:hypothetical protein